jgi:hypothetical protein
MAGKKQNGFCGTPMLGSRLMRGAALKNFSGPSAFLD